MNLLKKTNVLKFFSFLIPYIQLFIQVMSYLTNSTQLQNLRTLGSEGITAVNSHLHFIDLGNKGQPTHTASRGQSRTGNPATGSEASPLDVSKTQIDGPRWFLRHSRQNLEILRNFKSFWYIFNDNHLIAYLITKVQSYDFRAYICFYIQFEPNEGKHMVQMKVLWQFKERKEMRKPDLKSTHGNKGRAN